MYWAEAEGFRVRLGDGRELIDLTAGFGVAALGHRDPRIVAAVTSQPVWHALGDLMFWIGAIVSFLGVGLVALGSGGGFESDVWGDVLAVMTSRARPSPSWNATRWTWS